MEGRCIGETCPNYLSRRACILGLVQPTDCRAALDYSLARAVTPGETLCDHIPNERVPEPRVLIEA